MIWLLILGVLIGCLLPFLDRLIYVFFIGPQELSSQRVAFSLKRGSLVSAIKLLIETRFERQSLIFHSSFFMVIVLALGFWLITSSASFLGKGIVWGMVAHLVVDRLITRLYHRAQ